MNALADAPTLPRPARELPLPALRLLESLGSRDPDLDAHCEAVGSLAGRLAAQLGMPAADVEDLELAGALHDVGKVAVPQRILQKAGALEEREWAEIRHHPVTGYLLVRSIGLERIAGWILLHHERPDGLGYPYGVGSEQIPIEAAILSVADVYHAMTTDRSYQRALSEPEARAEIRRCAGSQLDRDVVAALLQMTG